MAEQLVLLDSCVMFPMYLRGKIQGNLSSADIKAFQIFEQSLE
ncbi:hypothetical protein [Nostoc sp. UHCC 0251]|nr:hypothetical protein [Nostoc sp. UHCC 0251]MEA5623949.1 hypothetical protein [Nostoc sp. UHCC 0251]